MHGGGVWGRGADIMGRVGSRGLLEEAGSVVGLWFPQFILVQGGGICGRHDPVLREL